MSYLLPHLHTGYSVDQAILSEEDRVVIIRFGHDWDQTCMQMDEILATTADQLKNFAVIYLVDLTEIPDFNTMYELYDPCTVMFFFRNKHIMIDLGTGNNNKINWAMNNKQEFIDIVEVVYRGARKGRGLVVSPKDSAALQLQQVQQEEALPVAPGLARHPQGIRAGLHPPQTQLSVYASHLYSTYHGDDTMKGKGIQKVVLKAEHIAQQGSSWWTRPSHADW
ncbi:Thioredoxin-like 4A [Trebouxia sp. C0009 RCD-2024]